MKLQCIQIHWLVCSVRSPVLIGLHRCWPILCWQNKWLVILLCPWECITWTLLTQMPLSQLEICDICEDVEKILRVWRQISVVVCVVSHKSVVNFSDQQKWVISSVTVQWSLVPSWPFMLTCSSPTASKTEQRRNTALQVISGNTW